MHDSRVVRGRGHIDDPWAEAGPPRPLQYVQQQVGEQEMSQVVEHKVELEALLRALLGNQHGSSFDRTKTVEIKRGSFLESKAFFSCI